MLIPAVIASLSINSYSFKSSSTLKIYQLKIYFQLSSMLFITSYHNQHDFYSHYQQTGEIMFCWLPQAPGRWLIYQSHVDTPGVERSEIYR